MSSRPDFPDFRSPYRFEYPSLWVQVGGSLLFVFVLGGILALVIPLRNGDGSIALDQLGLLGIGLTFLVTLVVHEAIHGAVAHWLGYRVTFGISWSVPGAYAAAFGQPISRWDNALVAAAPLVVITVVGGACLFVVNGTLLAAILVALFTNTAGAVNDVYLLYRLGRLPHGSILYVESMEEILVYKPA